MKREYRLKRRAAFAYVYRKGERAGTRHLTLLYAKSGEGLKIGLSVSKKIGNAVVRNRVKRLLREGVGPLLGGIDPAYMYVVIARPSIANASFGEISAELEKAFSRAGKYRADQC